ncbi:MAG: pyridoxal 5-phosphate synthase pdxT subunit [Chloroflexota bacterium]|nr:pyridoxal 5-phosphate synthase pdxT subunit [Chloroflexota bacterium]
MSRPRIGVLALQGAFREHIAALERLGADAIPVRSPEEIAGLDGVVLPGGESTTMDKLLRRFQLQVPLRDSLREGLPALATCAGVILLAEEVRDGLPDQETLGILPIAVRRNAYGRQPESFEDGLELDFLDAPFPGVFIRAPVVESGVETMEVHGVVDGRPVAMSHGNVLALTFHPELSGDDRVHEFFLERHVGAAAATPRRQASR